MAVKRLLLKQSAKAGGAGVIPALCECLHHGDAYNEMSGATAFTFGIDYEGFDDGAVILSQAITITETCCVNAVGTIVSRSVYAVTDFKLERPLGTIVVDQEDETPSNLLSMFHYSSWEVLSPGTYTYYLVNRSGASLRVNMAQLKIVAFECTGPPCACQYHTHAYNEMFGTIGDVALGGLFTSFADDAVILSQAITTTEECCVLAVGTIFAGYRIVSSPVLADFELEQPLGTIVVDEEDETKSAIESLFLYSAWEVLPADTYTYNLVNRAGEARYITGAQLKIIAVRCVEV